MTDGDQSSGDSPAAASGAGADPLGQIVGTAFDSVAPKPGDPTYLGCLVIFFIAILAFLLIGLNAARTPSPDAQNAALGGHAVAKVVESSTSQSLPPTPEPQSLSPLPPLGLLLFGAVSAPTSTPAPAEPTPEPQTSSTTTTTQTTTTQTTTTQTTHTTTSTATHTPPPPPQTCVATTITVTQSDGSSQTVSGSGSNTSRSFGFTMTGTSVTVHASDNPNCSPPHYKVAITSTDGSFANNCGVPASSDTTSFKDGSPGEQASVSITEVASCT